MTWAEPGSAYFKTPHFPLAIFPMAPQYPTPFHTHGFSELVLITAGETVHVIRGATGEVPQVRLLKAGNAFAVQPGQEHSYRITRGLNLVNILYDSPKLHLPSPPSAPPPGYRSLLRGGRGTRGADFDAGLIWLEPAELTRAAAMVAEIGEELNSMRPGWELTATGAFLQLLVLAARAYAERDPRTSRIPEWMPPLLQHLETGCHPGITLEDLARAAGTSPSNLSHAFAKAYGCAPIEYVIGIRLQKAAELLRDTEQPISQVAWAAGFPDHNYLSRQFRRHMGYTPSRYRAHYRRLGRTAQRLMAGT